MSKNSESWQKIYDDLKIFKHDFNKEPFYLSAKQIKISVKDFKRLHKKKCVFYVNKTVEKIDRKFL